MLNRREELIDIVKGIGIILVIIGHCNHFFTYESKPIVLIYGFHMPLFIFVSSILVFLTLDKNISVKKKISRNEKCPCGSGLKYKFCCGKNK